MDNIAPCRYYWCGEWFFYKIC